MMNSFAIFIMVHGRPDKDWTYKTLKKHGYTGKIYLVADDLDESRLEYQKIYGDELIVFDKKKAAAKMEAGDNTGDLRSTLFSANTIFDLAKERGIKYFFIMCDDYTRFEHKINTGYQLKTTPVKNLDRVIKGMLNFYKNTTTTSLAMAQGGDFIGGKDSQMSKNQMKRKAMNTFLCSTDRPFKFIGRLNEDVSTYVNLGSTGKLFITLSNISIIQNRHQAEKGGLTDVYLDEGTYIKSFFSVMYNPSSVKIQEMGDTHKRIHHKIKWNNAVPKILNEKHKRNGTE